MVDMLFSVVLFAIESVLLKYLYTNAPYFDGFTWVRIGSFFASLPLLLMPQFRKGLSEAISSTTTTIKSIVIGSEGINLAAIASLDYATSLASVSLVSALSGLQPAILLLYAIILSVWFPKILREELDRKTILSKAVAVTMMALGVYLIAI